MRPLYAVALTDEPGRLRGTLPAAPISRDAVAELLTVRSNELTLDGVKSNVDELVTRLAAFWLPDEVVQYIGLAGPRRRRQRGEVAKRVGDYYKTPLGARALHSGGWPLKTLSCLGELFVHYGFCSAEAAAESAALACFASQVSETARAGLHDPVNLMPFANLEFPKGTFKAHGIRGACAPKARRPEDTESRPDTRLRVPLDNRPARKSDRN